VLIDWLTVGAQIVNFLVLVALLKKFLYGPIVKAMDEREAAIAGRLREARDRKQDAEEEAELYRSKNRELEDRRREKIEEAEKEAEERRKELVQSARREAEDKRRAWRKAVEEEKEAFRRDLRLRVTTEVFAIARRVLQDLSDADVEKQLVKTFARRVREADFSREKIRASSDDPVVVSSTFSMDEEGREVLAQALRERLGEEREMRFESSSEGPPGVTAKIGGYKMAWSVADYLDTLEERLKEALEREPPEGEEE